MIEIYSIKLLSYDFRMVMELQTSGLLVVDIDKFTKLGSEQLQNGHMEKAQQSFELAYRRSKELDDGFTERACAFNLGALYIAFNKPDKGKSNHNLIY